MLSCKEKRNFDLKFFALLMALLVCSLNVWAVYPIAIDGDSVLIGKREIRLSGIDAPEYNQECFTKDKKSYSCGLEAKKYLESLLNDKIVCETITVDKYKREVAFCKVGSIDINEKMVEMGMAVAYKRYTHDYDEAERIARANKRGIWQGKFMKPELHRILNKE